MKFLMTFMHGAFILLMLGIAALFLVPLLPLDHNLELRIVESGSMEPAIPTGSLIMVLPKETYAIGDVIMFDGRFGDVPTTHRVADINEDNGTTWFVTKGDANEEADTDAVRASDVMGSVRFSVPYAGYVLDFARQPLGFIFLIVIPAFALVVGEIEKIWLELRGRRKVAPVARAEGSKQGRVRPAESSVLQPVTLAPQPKVSAPARAMMDIRTPVRTRNMYTLDLRGMVPYRPEPRSWLPHQKMQIAGIVLAILVSSALVGLGFLGSTVAYFNDVEASLANAFGAVELDFTAVADGELFSFEDGVLVGDDDGAVVTNVMLEPGSVDARFDVEVEYISGVVALCDAINAVSLTPFAYDGSLTALSTTDTTFSAPWSLALSIPDHIGLSNGDTCVVNVVLTAWHFDTELDEGYVDEERVPLSFTLIGAAAAGAAAPGQLQVAPLSAPAGRPQTLDTDEEVLPDAGVDTETVTTAGASAGSEPATDADGAPEEKQVGEEETIEDVVEDPVVDEEVDGEDQVNDAGVVEEDAEPEPEPSSRISDSPESATKEDKKPAEKQLQKLGLDPELSDDEHTDTPPEFV